MNVYQEFIHKSRYARWDEAKNRRETWEETVDRYVSFMFSRSESLGYKLTDTDKNKTRSMILSMDIMPSMRALMTAGKALEIDHVAGFNCSFVGLDHPKSFDEIMFVLMCGTGVGYSVENKYISKLPVVAEEFTETDTTIIVGDSKIGWASAFRELLSLLYAGKIPKWDVSKVRPAGARLKTFGGRASGPAPLVSLFEYACRMFKKAAGRKLTSIECHDLVCKIADIVVVGGVEA